MSQCIPVLREPLHILEEACNGALVKLSRQEHSLVPSLVLTPPLACSTSSSLATCTCLPSRSYCLACMLDGLLVLLQVQHLPLDGVCCLISRKRLLE